MLKRASRGPSATTDTCPLTLEYTLIRWDTAANSFLVLFPILRMNAAQLYTLTLQLQNSGCQWVSRGPPLQTTAASPATRLPTISQRAVISTDHHVTQSTKRLRLAGKERSKVEQKIGQIWRYQLSLLFVTTECVHKIQRFSAHANYTEADGATIGATRLRT